MLDLGDLVGEEELALLDFEFWREVGEHRRRDGSGARLLGESLRTDLNFA